MNEQPKEQEDKPGTSPPDIHIDWGYERPQRGIRSVEPSVTRREITIEPPPTRSATPADGTIVVKPRLRTPQTSYRIWLAAFTFVSGLTLALTLLLVLGLALN
jgi:hypothetical protein